MFCHYFVINVELLSLRWMLQIVRKHGKYMHVFSDRLSTDRNTCNLHCTSALQMQKAICLPRINYLFTVFSDFPCSGKVIRHFVPIDKILKPVLLECVTPVTCYWNLSLLVRGEELVLVFKVNEYILQVNWQEK